MNATPPPVSGGGTSGAGASPGADALTPHPARSTSQRTTQAYSCALGDGQLYCVSTSRSASLSLLPGGSQSCSEARVHQVGAPYGARWYTKRRIRTHFGGLPSNGSTASSWRIVVSPSSSFHTKWAIHGSWGW